MNPLTITFVFLYLVSLILVKFNAVLQLPRAFAEKNQQCWEFAHRKWKSRFASNLCMMVDVLNKTRIVTINKSQNARAFVMLYIYFERTSVAIYLRAHASKVESSFMQRTCTFLFHFLHVCSFDRARALSSFCGSFNSLAWKQC